MGGVCPGWNLSRLLMVGFFLQKAKGRDGASEDKAMQVVLPIVSCANCDMFLK